MNKTIIGVVIIAIFIGGIIYFVSRTPDTSNVSLNTAKQNQNTGAQGRVVFSVTDAAVNLSTISEINMTVSSIAMHSVDDGWVTVSTTPRTYSLLALNANNKSDLLADISTKVGTYDQVRLMIDSIIIKTKAGVTKEAKLPSNELKLNTMLVVNADKTLSVNFDFLADKSLHITGNGEYIFAPVVKTRIKSKIEVTIKADNTIEISDSKDDDEDKNDDGKDGKDDNGKDDDSNDDEKIEGMDIDGSVRFNFQIKSDEKLDIDDNDNIKRRD